MEDRTRKSDENGKDGYLYLWVGAICMAMQRQIILVHTFLVLSYP
jgi:hypothetical protein